MVLLLVVIGFIGIGIFVFIQIIVKSVKKQDQSKSKSIPIKGPASQHKSETDLYKNKGIKTFQLKGIEYLNLSKSMSGKFIGYAKTEDNIHDQYAVAVYKNPKTHIGYVPIGNKTLQNSLKEWHNGKTFAWGTCDYWEYEKEWKGYVHMLVGLDADVINIVKEIVSTQEMLDNLEKDLPVNKKMEMLETVYLVKERMKTIEHYFTNNHPAGDWGGVFTQPLNFKIVFPKTFIPSLSKELELSKDWQNLIKLEKYTFLVDELNEKMKNSTLKRIQLAKDRINAIKY